MTCLNNISMKIHLIQTIIIIMELYDGGQQLLYKNMYHHANKSV